MGNTTEKGDEFENRVFNIFSTLLKQEQLFLPGARSQIYRRKAYYSDKRESNIIVDIAIETFNQGADKYSTLTIIECKDYSSAVPIDAIEEFSEKVNQIAGKNTKAIFVTSGPYHESVFRYATNSGIALVRILADDEVKWDVAREGLPVATRTIAHQSPSMIASALLNFSITSTAEFIFGFHTDRYYSILSLLLSDLVSEVQPIAIPNRTLLRRKPVMELPEGKVPFLSDDDIEAIVADLLREFDASLLAHPKDINLSRLQVFLEDSHGVNFNFNRSLGQSESFHLVLGRVSFDPDTIEVTRELEIGNPRWKFTFAHELGHVFLHKNYLLQVGETMREDLDIALFPDAYGRNTKRSFIEIQANVFAAALLLPRHPFLLAVTNLANSLGVSLKGNTLLYLDQQQCNKDDYFRFTNHLMETFKVSREAIKIRLIKFNLLKEPKSKYSLFQRYDKLIR